MSTIVQDIRKSSGIAGQVAYAATVQYDGEPVSVVTFIGSVYGGPIIMRTPMAEVFVREPDRFGAFGPDWVRAFFA